MVHLTDTDEVQSTNIGEILRGKVIEKVHTGYPPDLAGRSVGVDSKTLKWWRRHLGGFEKELQRAIDAAGGR